MKQTKTKTLCLLLAALMLLSSLTACGKDKEKDSNLIKLGDYELLYKGACIMEDSDGNDAIVLSLDFTNNSKENASYLWSVDETLMQNGTELEVATVYTDYYKWISEDDESHFIYVNFKETVSGVYTVSGFNTSGFSGKEAIARYLDTVKAEAAEAN